MDLGTYLETSDVKLADLAERVGVKPASLYRYVSRARLPRREIMLAIERETDGAVQPADFYASPASAA